jgi:hypothetical protein
MVDWSGLDAGIRILPGDLVSFKPDADVTVVDNGVNLAEPAHSPFTSNADNKRLQEMWRARYYADVKNVLLVVCCSKNRALVLHPTGKFLLATATQFVQHPPARR